MFGLWNLFCVGLLFVNSFAILNEHRILKRFNLTIDLDTLIHQSHTKMKIALFFQLFRQLRPLLIIVNFVVAIIALIIG